MTCCSKSRVIIHILILRGDEEWIRSVVTVQHRSEHSCDNRMVQWRWAATWRSQACVCSSCDAYHDSEHHCIMWPCILGFAQTQDITAFHYVSGKTEFFDYGQCACCPARRYQCCVSVAREFARLNDACRTRSQSNLTKSASRGPIPRLGDKWVVGCN